MSHSGPAGGYAPTESFESGRVTAVAADADRVVLGTDDGAVEIVAADGRTTVAFEAPIADLAVGNRVYALADGSVVALSTAGTRVWSVELPEASELAALPEADVLGVVTDDDRLVGFDGETGGQEFGVDRPHADVTGDPGFFGTDGAFVLVAWSFLAVRNLDGSERFDENLDGAIESAGIVDDTIVVSLKDERVVGVDLTTGEKQWERELAVADLPDRGDDALLFTAEGKLVSLEADGTYTPVEDLPSGDVYPTSDGDLFCAVADGTIAVYSSTADPADALDVAVEDPRLVPGETDAVDLRVENVGDRPVAAPLRAVGDGAALDRTEWTVDLAPGESATRSLRVESVRADDTAALAVESDGDHLASLSLSVEAPPGASLAAEVELDAVTDGAAALTVAVENEGDAPATHVSVSPGDVKLGRLAPGESAAAELELPFEPGTAVPVAVRGDAAAAEVEAALPDRGCRIDVDATDGFVDVTVENPTDATVADDLAVAGDCFDAPVERRVELGAGERLVVALRPERTVETADVDAGLVGLGASASARFDGRRFGRAGRGGSGRSDGRPPERERPSRRDGRSPREDGRREDSRRAEGERSPRRERGRGGESRERDRRPRRESDRRSPRREADRRPPRRETDRRPAPRDRDGRSPRRESGPEPRREESPRPAPETESDARQGDAPRRDDPGDSTGSDESRRRDASASASAMAGGDAAEDAATVGDAAGATGPVLAADRRLETTDPARTHGVRERIAVRNEGDDDATGVELSLADETVSVGDLAPDDRATVERSHAFFDAEATDLPAGRVAGDDADCAVESERVSVEPADLAAEVVFALEEDGYLVRAKLENGRDVDCAVERIGTRELGIWDADCRVPAGETVEWTRRVDGSGLDGAVETVVEYAFADGETERFGTLGRVGEASATDSAGIETVAVNVGDETRVSGGYGSVVVVVENRGDSPVEDLSVEATGEAVSDLMYAGGEDVERLEPGDEFTHFVDVETDGPEASVSVSLSADGDESEVTVCGPAPAEEDDWSDETLADWSVERGDADDGRPSHLRSTFEDA
ncbi:PQQ-binding-like beta-propeller repeat protein [Halorussus gelatinilyticus]|uniref:PQQ-binding-like beta-propeller repeat protein n=1 Tax=Halorussus gelatinilyticus TaxID=2937524 RepID=A0A8U0INE9_9EURY|nr:PQQ-binding-like beta-propeller repeat protein [Halorussus gelatinilyticus]UPW02278.1 PQQ-binding-like beta-propeller repeat protein [Halorussus gelatinilyticus]